MTTSVVLGSRFDAMFMTLLLNPEIRSLDLNFLASDPSSSIDSSARSPLPIGEGHDDRPVAGSSVVLDLLGPNSPGGASASRSRW